MIKLIDNALNRITMYRLTLYYLIFLLGTAIVLSALGTLPYDPLALMFTISFLLVVCWATNSIFAWAFNVAPNVESVYITALILALIIAPLQGYGDLWFIGWAGVLAMASKYIIAIRKSHLFNPAAFAVALTALAIGQTAVWWVGNGPMLPFVLIGGLLLLRKLDRFDLLFGFFTASITTIIVFTLWDQGDIVGSLQNAALYSPMFFFAFIILTEPLTMPPTRALQMLYGALAGFLFAPDFHIGALYITPEIAILVANLFAYIVVPRTRLTLTLLDKLQLAPDIYEFVFKPARQLAFEPGQYMEWTLAHESPDNRGNRRFFTLASAPTEPNIRLGVKFYPRSSSYKQSMLEMHQHDEIIAAQIAGDFVLPTDRRKKCVLIAGGIGITPFRSMLKYLLDTHQKRPLALLYSNKSAGDFVYKDVLEQAQRKLGTKVVYTVTDRANVPAWWQGKVGRINGEMIKREIPDYKDCIFYVSGPNTLVNGVKDSLRHLHVPADHIRTDTFSGLA